MMSFLTVTVLVLRPATTMLVEVAIKGKGIWTTGACLCLVTTCSVNVIRVALCCTRP